MGAPGLSLAVPASFELDSLASSLASSHIERVPPLAIISLTIDPSFSNVRLQTHRCLPCFQCCVSIVSPVLDLYKRTIRAQQSQQDKHDLQTR